MTEFLDKPAEKSGKVLAAFLEGLPLVWSAVRRHVVDQGRRHGPSITYIITPCWFTLLQPARRAAVLGQLSSLRPQWAEPIPITTKKILYSFLVL
jgi:hypothetical protein